MKNLITLMLFSVCLLSCGQKEKVNYKLIATCDKIIVQDSIENHTINFLVSFKNLNDKDLTLFANSYAQNYSNKEYEKTGIFLKLDGFDTPIAQFHPSNKFIVEAGKTLKLLYTYSDKYPNMKIAFSQNESYMSQLKKVKLYYKFDHALAGKLFQKEENYIKSNFNIDMSKAVIEFKKDLNIEEAIRLVDGKINGQ